MVCLKKIIEIIKLSLLCAIIGVIGGFAGGCFSYVLSAVTNIRADAQWLVLLLPAGGIVTVALYRIFRMEDYGGTNEVIRRIEKTFHIRPVAALLIFVSTVITHLFGGSAGREGAAIQLGGAGASALADVFRLKHNRRTVFIMSGMGAVFAGVFGTPLTAAVFILEFKSDKKVFPLSVLPCFTAAITAWKTSALMGVCKETACFSTPFVFSFLAVAKILLLSVGISILSNVMCIIFNKSEHLMNKLIANPFLRSVVCSVILVALTWIVGDMRYNGSGMNMAIDAVEGNSDWYDFILKIIFTAITVAAGFKGGEIVPTFCIGATFGCFLGSLLGMNTGFAAALGLIGLFCCATYSPLSAVVLGVEMFGFSVFPYSVIVCLIVWLLSGNNGLFYGRFFKSPIFGRIKKAN